MPEPTVSCCPPELRHQALRRVMPGLSDQQQGNVLESLTPLAQQGFDVFAGLWTALSPEGTVQGVAWLQPQVGRTATLWPPQTTSGDKQLDQQLVQQAVAASASLPVDLVQSILPSRSDPLIANLLDLGFVYLADLRYLMLEVPAGRDVRPPAGLRLESPALRDAKLFEQVLQGTYIDTLDCPALEGLRRMEDVIAGYQTIGSYDPSLWFLAWRGDEPAGVLLLAPYPDAGQWELVYMGVLPDFRGSGVGRQMLQAATQRAAAAGVEKVVLAVDSANSPAVRMYERAGFVEWARRSAYIYGVNVKLAS